MYKDAIKIFLAQHREDMIEDIIKLVRIKSFRGETEKDCPYGRGPAQALQTAAEMLTSYGFSVKNYDNKVITADLNEQSKQLDILAHLDVVPGGEGWTVTEAFEPRLLDGKIYGRGTADDKGPIAAAVYAMRAVKELNIPLSKNVRLILGSDEECGMSDIKHYYSREPEAPMTFSPDSDFPLINVEKGWLKCSFQAELPVGDAVYPNSTSEDYDAGSADMASGNVSDRPLGRAVVISIDAGEGSNIVPAAASALLHAIDLQTVSANAEKVTEQTGVAFAVDSDNDKILLTAQGKNAHSSSPQNGNNALTALLQLLNRLPLAENSTTKLIDGLSRLFPHGEYNGRALGIYCSDEISGQLTASLNMLKFDGRIFSGTFDCRTPICGDIDNLAEICAAKLRQKGFSKLSLKTKTAHHVSAESDFVRQLLECYQEISGQQGQAYVSGGLSYVHNLSNGVAFGCADRAVNNHMHGSDEFVIVDQLMMSAEIFAAAIIKLCI